MESINSKNRIYTKSAKITPLVVILAGLCVFVSAMLFIYPKASGDGVITGLLICANILIPSLFPFMAVAIFIGKSGASQFIGKLFTPITKALFKLPGSASAAIIMSYLAGYPVGARMAKELYNKGEITKNQAGTMMLFTINAGPAFVLTAVSLGMLHCAEAGAVLLTAHVAASLIIGIFACQLSARKNKPMPRAKQSTEVNNADKPQMGIMDAFVESTADAVSTMFGMCGFVLLFSAIIAILKTSGLPDAIINLLAPFLEVTTGATVASASSNLPLIAAVLGWGGLSVHFQVISAAGEIRPSLFKFFFARLMHGILSYVITWLILQIFSVDLTSTVMETMSNNVSITAADGFSIPATLALITMSVVLLVFIGDKFVKENKMKRKKL